MRLLANQLPPDGPGTSGSPAGENPPLANASRPLTDEDRLAVFTPAILAALQHPAPAAGCRRSQEDPFWGSGAEAAGDPAAMSDIAAAAAGYAARASLEAATRLKVTVIVEHEGEPEPARPTRPWSDGDEERYQASLMWECAVYHWYE